MSDFKIEDNVPWSPRTKVKDRYPLEQLEIGQSFFIPLNGGNWQKERNRLSAAIAYMQNARPGKRFTTRRMHKEDGEEGLRVWRLV